MYRSINNVGATEELAQDNLDVLRALLPIDICEALHEYVSLQPERNMVHQLTGDNKNIPMFMAEAVSHMPLLGVSGLVMTKRYDSSEEEAAFAVAHSSEDFEKGPIVSCLLGGSASLEVVDKDNRLTVVSGVPNTFALSRDNMSNIVKPSLKKGISTYMFSASKITNLDRSHRLRREKVVPSITESRQGENIGMVRYASGEVSFIASGGEELFADIGGKTVLVKLSGKAEDNPESTLVELHIEDPITKEVTVHRGKFVGSIMDARSVKFLRDHKKGEIAGVAAAGIIGVAMGSLIRHAKQKSH